jgi:thymidylate synthase (FAD)
MARTSLKAVLLTATPDPQEIVAMSARLCYSESDIADLQKGVGAKDQSGYIKRLVDMGHLSPVEHCSFSFGIEGVSRSLLAQITRHRIASFSVQSQRYVSKVQQVGCFSYILPPAIEALGLEAVAVYDSQMQTMQQWYNEWHEKLGTGESSNEDARFVLPNACETRMVVTMNARELQHFFNLRCCNRAQWEIRALAWEMLKLCCKKAPALFADAGPGCVANTCPEGKMSCGKSAEVRKKKEGLLCLK